LKPHSPWLAVAAGLGLGACIALLEFVYYYPLIAAPRAVGLDLLLSLLVIWCGEGLLLGLAIVVFQRRAAPQLLSPCQITLAVLIGSVPGVFAWQALVHGILRAHYGFRVVRDYVGQPVSITGVALYHVWLMLLFGGLAATLYGAWQRQQHMLAVLRQAELARERSQRELANAQFESLRARVDPELLFQKFRDLERLYETAPADADQLLEELIAFLRTAKEDR
jgi:hypothetical protein